MILNAYRSDIPRYVNNFAGRYRVLSHGSHAPMKPRTDEEVNSGEYKFMNIPLYVYSSGAKADIFPSNKAKEACSPIYAVKKY
jgi:hypothetical protein